MYLVFHVNTQSHTGSFGVKCVQTLLENVLYLELNALYLELNARYLHLLEILHLK